MRRRLTTRAQINVLLAASAGLLGLGLALPILTLKQLVWVENTFSLLGGSLALITEGEVVLGLILLIFSVLFPISKLGLIATLNNRQAAAGQHRERLSRWLASAGRWSMLDVFVVAVLVASVKLGAVASIEIHAGLYCFAGAVLGSSLALYLVEGRN